MPITSDRQAELFEKLVTIADGDTKLVERAIWVASAQGTKNADLADVLAYIKRHTASESEKEVA